MLPFDSYRLYGGKSPALCNHRQPRKGECVTPCCQVAADLRLYSEWQNELRIGVAEVHARDKRKRPES